MNSLVGLNPEQRKAVEYIEGPSLIFAGAGSGKTKVLTHKIAYLIENGIVAPEHILAVTFTNKAAKELRSRVESFIGNKVQAMTVGTFHSICARILRREIEHLGYARQFSIYDEDDQKALLKKIVSDRSIILEGTTVKNILSRISLLKNQMIAPEDFEPRPGSIYEQQVKLLYPLYQQALQKLDALDFDDLLILPLKIFDQYPEVLKKYQHKYRFILIDEYQDTNRPQFLFMEMLGRSHKHVCVVGDDDQSIYSWRGADIENILRFDRVFQGCAVFKLEQNYRSTNNILKAASAVVRCNQLRADKTLWSQKEDGALITKIDADNEYDEAARIVSNIQNEIHRAKRKFKDFAILYRTNAQTRVLEEIFRRNNIVYTIVGGVRFYERKEIKDLLAYFQIYSNPKDDISFRRIINIPPRGIGKTTLGELEKYAQENNLSLFDALEYIDALEVGSRSTNALKSFRDLVRRSQSLRQSVSFEEWSRVVIDDLGIRSYYKESGGEEARQRMANIDEFLNDISDYCSKTDDPNLESYLETVSLASSIDVWEDEKNAVSMMTLHSAKGLEFPVVGICGLNQGLLPLNRDNSEKALEEERRLFYVGLTRAKEKVFLTSSQSRSIAGETQFASESIFMREIPEELITRGTALEGVVAPRSSRKPRRYAAASVSFDGESQTASRPAKPGTEIKPGSLISHKIFGIGKVQEMQGSGQNARLRIYFKTEGMKTIIARYVKPVSR